MYVWGLANDLSQGTRLESSLTHLAVKINRNPVHWVELRWFKRLGGTVLAPPVAKRCQGVAKKKMLLNYHPLFLLPWLHAYRLRL
jgi:hypothetical protein